MKTLVPTKVLIPLLLGLAISIAVVVFAERGYRRLEAANRTIATSFELQNVLTELRALVTDAETGQRGYLLTGDKRYLEPYRDAKPKIIDRFARVRDFVSRTDGIEQLERLAKLEHLIDTRLAEVQATIAVFEKSGGKAALERTNTDVGIRTMEEIRGTIDAMATAENARLFTGIARWDRDITTLRTGLQVMTGLTVALLLIVLLLARRELAARERVNRLMVEDQRRLEAEVEKRTEELAALSSYLQNVREEEKRKLARDLHDELGSLLISAKMDAAWVKSRLGGGDSGALSGRLEGVLGMLDEAVHLKRRIIEDLRPSLLDTVGLVATLEWQVGEACQRAGIAWGVTASGLDEELPDDISIALFRIVQEAVTNALRHARPRRVGIDIVRVEREVVLTVKDDGIGISESVQRKGISHGIAGMRQRVRALHGKFSIRRLREAGTVIEVRIPLRSDEVRGDVSTDRTVSA